MSGFAAFLAINGSPVDRTALSRLCDAAPFRGTAHTWTDSPVTLAAFGSGGGPDRAPGEGATVVFDGRLDNRRDLADRLGLSAWRAMSDAAIVRHAYERWNADCAALLLGDFAFAVWDAHRRELFCARDPLGVRPFYYAMAHGRFVAASDLLQILAASPVRPRPNEGMIAEYLAGAIRSQVETVYDGIVRLPHGHWLRVSPDGRLASSPYWHPGEQEELRYATDDQYADEFRGLFLEAVRCRFPDDEAAAIYLSGGVDSSAVTAAACALAPAAPPVAFSLAFGDDPEIHERRYMRDVSEWTGIENVVTRAEDPMDRPPPPFNRDPADFLRDLPADEWKRTIRARGIRVALTGQGGDDGFLGSQYHYADLLKRGRARDAWRQWRADAAVLGGPPSILEFVRFGVWPLLPSKLRAVAAPAARRAAGEGRPGFEWIEPAFGRRVDLASRLEEASHLASGSSARDDIVRGSFESGWKYIYHEAAEREASERDLEERHPFLDRRVVDFALRLPDEQRWRGDITRFVVRKAFHHELPPSLRTRRSTGEGIQRLVSGIQALGGGRLLDRLALAEAGWVRQEVVSRMHERMRARFATGHPEYVADAQALWTICGTELWFRNVYGGR